MVKFREFKDGKKYKVTKSNALDVGNSYYFKEGELWCELHRLNREILIQASVNDVLAAEFEEVVEKKKFWLFDIKSRSGFIFKSSTYLDVDGRDITGECVFDADQLVKKHEDEFIEV